MKPVTTEVKLAKVLSWIIAAILALLPFHAFFTTWLGSSFGYLNGWRVWKEFILLLILPAVFYLAWRSTKIRHWLRRSWISWAILSYMILFIVHGIYSVWTKRVDEDALTHSLIINLRFLVFFGAVLIIASFSNFLLNNWRKILLLPAAGVVGFGLIQKFVLPIDFLKHFGYGPGTIQPYQTVDQQLAYLRLQSTLRGANPLGAYIVLISTALLGNPSKYKWLRWIALLAALTVLFYSFSRSAWAGLIMSALAFLLLSELKNKTRLIFLIGPVFFIAAGIVFYFASSGQAVRDILLHTTPSSNWISYQTSDEVRLEAYKKAVSDIAREPLGRGLGTAGPASVRNDEPVRMAENYFLQIGQEVGVLGMTLFIAINFLAAKQLWYRRQTQLAKVLLAAFVGLTFINLVSHAWTDDTLAYLWWGLAGIALAPVIITDRHKRNGKAQQSKTKT